MGTLAGEFRAAYTNGSGAELAELFSPIAPENKTDRRRLFADFTNPAYLIQDLKSTLFQGKNLRLSRAEQDAWIDIFAAYWEAVGEILRVESGRPGASAATIFLAWKKVANALIKGYSSIPPWTLPCLYIVGKFVRIFAIKADIEVASKSSGHFDFREDPSADANANMEEAARIINRMFTLCLNDR